MTAIEYLQSQLDLVRAKRDRARADMESYAALVDQCRTTKDECVTEIADLTAALDKLRVP